MGKDNSRHSFKEYIKERFLSELESAVEEYIKETDDELEINLRNIRNVSDCGVDSLEIKTVWIEDCPNMEIPFKVVTQADLWFEDDRSDEEDSCLKWFLIECRANLGKKMNDFEILNVCAYDGNSRPRKALSDRLVPYISEERYEEEAETFLKKYYPEALEGSFPVDVGIVLSRMGLKAEKRFLSSDCDVFGECIFDDCDITIYSEKTGLPVTEHFTAGTILYDQRVFFLRNLGCTRNTIIHECIHWDIHRKTFEFVKLLSGDTTRIKCMISGNPAEDLDNEEVLFMELQANAIAPRILAPAKSFINRTNELISICEATYPDLSQIDFFDIIIQKLASDFQISKESVKIRLLETGFETAEGLLAYIDGKKIRPYSFRHGSLGPYQTFCVDIKDLVTELVFHPELKKSYDTGRLLYVESHLCLNNPEYIDKDEKGRKILSEYARHNINECCIKFDVEPVSKVSEMVRRWCVLCRNINPDIKIKTTFSTEVNKNISDRTKAILSNYSIRDEGLALINKKSFSDTLVNLMKWRNMSEKTLADKSLQSEKTIQRYRNRNSSPTKYSSIALCIGLDLPYEVAREFLTTAGIALSKTDEDLLLDFFISDGCTYDIYECQDYLTANRFKGFCKESEEDIKQMTRE